MTSSGCFQLRPCAVASALCLVVLAGCPSASRSKGRPGATATETQAPFAQVVDLETRRADPKELAPFLKSTEPAVRARAVLALARLEHTATEPLLLSVTTDPDVDVRTQVAFALGQLDLALEAGNARHDAVRARVEAAMTAWWTRERNASVRRSVARGLGRIATSEGLVALIQSANVGDPLRADILFSLGVAGARRSASLKDNQLLTTVVARSLADPDALVRAGAAYVAFRQKLALAPDVFVGAATGSDADVRIFMARALPAQSEAVAASVTQALSLDADWRVRVELVRALAQRPGPFEPVGVALSDAVARLLRGVPSEAHVVAAACGALAGDRAPAEVAVPALKAAVERLIPAREKHAAPACACAAALDAYDRSLRTIDRCLPAGASSTAVGKWGVEVAAHARVSSRERVLLLRPFLQAPEVAVRMVAAGALVDEGTPAAAEFAAARLAVEADPGVADTLLAAFLEGPQKSALSDDVMLAVEARFANGGNLEELAPLVSLGAIVRGRTTPKAAAVIAALQRSAEPRVREAAAGVAPGDRGFGPRATSRAAAEVAQLPRGAVLRTTRGNITLRFEREATPLAVANFVALAKKSFLTQTPFHRVVSDFVAQGGDRRGDGSGGPGYTIPCENTDASYRRGALGMALSGKDTGGSQFFLTHGLQPHLDGRYTLFGHMTEGGETLDALQPEDLLLGVDLIADAQATPQPVPAR